MTEPKAPKAAHLASIQDNAFLLPKKQRSVDLDNLDWATEVAKGIRLKMSDRQISEAFDIPIYDVKTLSYQIRCEWKESILDDLHVMMVDELANIDADERDLRHMFNAGMFKFKTDPNTVEDKDFVNNMTKIYGCISSAQDKRHGLTGLKAPNRVAVHSSGNSAGLVTQLLTILTSVVKDPGQLKEITHQMEGLVKGSNK